MVTSTKSPIITLILAIAMGLIYPAPLIAKEFEIFDGRVYNGRYYPRVDIIEWGTPSHMEFHIYSKSKPVDLAFELERKDGKAVMLVRYFMADRGEYLCRRVLAPAHFLPGFKIYKDISDKDMDSIIVSMDEIEQRPGLARIDKPAQYASCEDDAALDRMPASDDEEKAGQGAAKAAAVTAPPARSEAPAKTSNPHEDGPISPFSKW